MSKIKNKNKKNVKNVSLTKMRDYDYMDAIANSGICLIAYILIQFVVTFIVVLVESIKQTINAFDIETSNAIDKELIVSQALKTYENVSISQSVMVALMFSSLLTILFLLLRMKSSHELGEFKKLSIADVVKTLSYGVLFNLMISVVLNVVLPNVHSNANDTLEQMMGEILNGNFIVVLLTVGIIAPITEELVFRYGIFRSFAKVNHKVGIIVSGIIFGLIHMNLIQSTYAMLLGFLFAFIYYKSNNIMYPILLHIGINASSVITGTLFDNEYIGLGVCVLVSLIAILLVTFAQMILKKVRPNLVRNKSEKINWFQNK